MNNGYAQRVLGNEFTWNILHVPRRSGKTTLIMEWILETAQQNIMYLSPNPDGLPLIAKYIGDRYPGLVQMHGRDMIRLANGTTVFRTPEGTNTQGRRVDRIVVEDAGELSHEMVPVIRRLVMEGNVKVLVITSGVRENSFFSYFENSEVPLIDAYYEEYTWEHAVEDHIFSQEQIDSMRKTVGDISFKKMFGPWNTIKKFEVEKKNKNFKHLLKK